MSRYSFCSGRRKNKWGQESRRVDGLLYVQLRVLHLSGSAPGCGPATAPRRSAAAPPPPPPPSTATTTAAAAAAAAPAEAAPARTRTWTPTGLPPAAPGPSGTAWSTCRCLPHHTGRKEEEEEEEEEDEKKTKKGGGKRKLVKKE